MTAGLRRAGIGLVLLYAAVAVVTHHLAPEGFRPLFDGFAPPRPYNWVRPPPELARDNQPPAEEARDVPLGPDGSPVTNATTSDAQAIASLEAGSVPPNPTETAVRLKLTPVDPGTLGPLPPDVKAVGNAYLVSLAYLPSQTLVTQLTKPGTVALTASTPGDRLLYSPDGSSWQERPSRPYGDGTGRFSSLEATGYFLVAGHSAAAPPTATAQEKPFTRNTFFLLFVGLVPIVGAALVLRPPPPLPARPAPGKRSGRRPAKSRSRSARKRRR